MKLLLIAPAAMLLLTACRLDEPDATQTDTCGATGYAALIGTPQADHDFSNAFRPHRIIPPKSAITMDYNPERLNVDVTPDGVITRFWCG